jgi:hypothetical protein
MVKLVLAKSLSNKASFTNAMPADQQNIVFIFNPEVKIRLRGHHCYPVKFHIYLWFEKLKIEKLPYFCQKPKITSK